MTTSALSINTSTINARLSAMAPKGSRQSDINLEESPKFQEAVEEATRRCIRQYRHHLHRVIGRGPKKVIFYVRDVEAVPCRRSSWKGAESILTQQVTDNLQKNGMKADISKTRLRRDRKSPTSLVVSLTVDPRY